LKTAKLRLTNPGLIGARVPLRSPRFAVKVSWIVATLLDWFHANARDLPWRRTSDPYAIWVSEIMLQQTQVSTVIPYWERWMRLLPNINRLAEADLQTLYKLWEGLGYYTRLRNLQKAAQVVMAHHHGQFPKNFDAILELPGVGPYTAGAICSIAFNEPHPILDGNVIRVLTRCFGIREDPHAIATKNRLWALARQLVQHAARVEAGARRNCSDLNQSLMELGALVCTAKRPLCSLCPLRTGCVAFRQGRVSQLPKLSPRVTITQRRFVAMVARHDNRFLVRQRPSGGVNANLWEFPNMEVTVSLAHESPAESALAILGNKSAHLKPICTIKHSITRYRITLEVFGLTIGSPRQITNGGGKWLPVDDLHKLPFASAHKKILAYLGSDSFRSRSIL
jgi:A/G-specific adenine glycosylase